MKKATFASQPLCHYPADDLQKSPSTAHQEVSLQHARLIMCDGERYAVLTQQGTRWVIPAAGCLLRPAIGDLVLVSLSGIEGYILTVLERAAPESPSALSVPGDLQLSLPQGRLMISAAQGMAINAGPALEVAATQLTAAVQRAEVACLDLQLTGNAAHVQWHVRTDIVDDLVEIAGHHESHAQQRVRCTTGHENVSAQSMRSTVDQDWSISADTADLKARERATVHAASVQLG